MVTIVQFGANGKKTGKIVVAKVVKSDAEWQKLLSPISYQVARQAGTERPYTGDSLNVHDRGLFRCICCDTAVFSSETKFDSGTGWPSFWQPIARENVVETTDRSWEWSEPQFPAESATLIWDTSSLTALLRRVCATA